MSTGDKNTSHGRRERSLLGSLRSQMASYTSVTPKQSLSTLVMQHITTDTATCVTTIQTPKQKKGDTLIVSWRPSAGSALNHTASRTPATTSSDCMTLP